MSAGFIGCEPKSIEVSDIVRIEALSYPLSWKAKCKDTTFICSELPSENARQVSCKPELK